MSEQTFQALLSRLIRAGLEGGLDHFALHRSLAVAGMEAIGECRCDLAACDEGEDEPPY
jgi:hypothetical protein